MANEISPNVARARAAIDRQCQQVALAVLSGFGDRIQRALHFGIVAFSLELMQALNLRITHGGIIHLAHFPVFLPFSSRRVLTPRIVSLPESM